MAKKVSSSTKKPTTKKTTTKKSTSNVKKIEEKKENNVVTGIISFIIALVVVVGGVYFVYTKFISVSSPTPKDYNNSFISDKDVNTIGLERYYWMVSHKNNETEQFVFFKDHDVTVNNIDNDDVLIMAYNSMNDIDRNHDYNCKDTTCYVDKFNVNILKEQVNNYFSKSVNVKYEDFRPTGNLSCVLNNNIYYCKIDNNNIKVSELYTIPGFINATVEGNKLYVYSSYVDVKRDLDVYKENERGVYAPNSDTKIDDLVEFKKIEYNLTRENANKFVKIYYDKGKIPRYRSTFVLYNNSYVWEKTELLK